MAQVQVSQFIYYWYSSTGLPPGAQHSWSFGPGIFWKTGLVATAHPRLWTGGERRLTVSMIQSHRTPTNEHFVHVFVRNVGPDPVHWYNLWLTIINPLV
jgi:hypothetical protein